jgi:phosphoketolase
MLRWLRCTRLDKTAKEEQVELIVIITHGYTGVKHFCLAAPPKEEAIRHCIKGVGIWDWASTDEGYEPDAVLVGCGDIATNELLAASVLLRDQFPGLRLRFINVVDLFCLEPATQHPHGSFGSGFRRSFHQG